jgi:hypothetical protein
MTINRCPLNCKKSRPAGEVRVVAKTFLKSPIISTIIIIIIIIHTLSIYYYMHTSILSHTPRA